MATLIAVCAMTVDDPLDAAGIDVGIGVGVVVGVGVGVGVVRSMNRQSAAISSPADDTLDADFALANLRSSTIFFAFCTAVSAFPPTPSLAGGAYCAAYCASAKLLNIASAALNHAAHKC